MWVRRSAQAACGFAAAFALLFGPARVEACGETLDEGRTLMDQLNLASVDPDQVYVLRHAQIARDRVKIYFNRGSIAFLSPVNGQVPGAVFSGEGEVLLVPVSGEVFEWKDNHAGDPVRLEVSTRSIPQMP